MIGTYALRARLAPAALAALPALVLLGASALSLEHAGSVFAFALSGAGVLVCGLVRDRGLSIQAALWESWGGPPTLQRMRWTSRAASEQVRLHRCLQRVTGVELPSQESERTNPEGADLAYERAIATLREATRDRRRFPLVFEENVDYGFRRNLLGIRPVGVAVAVVCLIVGGVLGIGNDNGGRFVLAAGVGGTAIAFWWKLVRPDWVRRAADRYADRLIDAAFLLESQSGSKAAGD